MSRPANRGKRQSEEKTQESDVKEKYQYFLLQKFEERKQKLYRKAREGENSSNEAGQGGKISKEEQ